MNSSDIRSRPFQFGAMHADVASREAWIDQSRKVESLGYSTLGMGEHPYFGNLALIPALMAAADATTTLRLATRVLINDFHHPVMLANEIATLDRLAGGRVEFGLGAGWLAQDYAAVGIPFDAPATRVERLEEAVLLIKQLFGDGPVTFHGRYYQVQELELQPKPLQLPHPPLFIGGGGKRLLSFAAREANIIGLHSKAAASGGADMATRSAEAFDQKVGWIVDAAGARIADVELNAHVVFMSVTDNRRQGADQLLRELADFPPGVVMNPPVTVEEVLEAPYILCGTLEQMAEDLQARRERYGISYITVNADLVDAFSPLVERLAGT
jgi:probable F420-dependent oxidoreductase